MHSSPLQYPDYPDAWVFWERNFSHIEQLVEFSAAIRKIMYVANVTKIVNASFRKVTNKGVFLHENALLKLLYLRTTELDRKWQSRKVHNWLMVMNQLSVVQQFHDKLLHYLQEA